MKTPLLLGLLLLSATISGACSEPKCGDNERRVGDTCVRGPKSPPLSDASDEATATQGDASIRGRSKFDAATRDAASELDAVVEKDSEPRDDTNSSLEDATVGESTACTTEEEVQCVLSGAQARRRCEAGKWSEHTSCGAGEVCDPKLAGACRKLDATCAGNAGKATCDGATMVFCDASGALENMSQCATPNHCQRGLSRGKCAICLPGEFRCTGAALERCADDGSSFELKESCATAALCNAEAESCKTGCTPGSKTCDGDTLRVCSADQTGFVDDQTCQAGLCDAANKECDVCVPGAKTCDQNKVRTCNSNGQTYAVQACAAPNSICTGKGNCVQCTAGSPCAQPSNPCFDATCDLAAGSCQSTPKRAGIKCPTGVCDGRGECLQCLEDIDCQGTAKRCSRNRCVACTSDSDCGQGKACQLNTCVDKVVCGDGIVNGSEQCDPGVLGTSPWKCNSSNCQKKTIYTSCATSSDCSAGELCLGQSLGAVYICTKFCDMPDRVGSESGCPATSGGLTAMCGGGLTYCMAANCTRDSDCAPGLSCFTGATPSYCMGCRTDGDCPSGKRCVIASGGQDGYCR